MIQLSLEMRNQLTGMMGYLQLITSGAFENDDELQTYAGSAYESAENAFTYIHDMSEATIGDTETTSKATLYSLGNIINPVIAKIKKETNSSLNVNFTEGGKESHVIADGSIIFDV
jgi:signal transduction histidine kinase